MKVKLISLLGLMVILVSCSTPSAPEYNPLPSYYQEVSRGWNFFKQDNYALAATSFRKAMVNDVDNSQSEAMIGLAWSLALQDSLISAVDNYEVALLRDPESPAPLIYALSGLSFCYRDLEPPDNEKVRDYALAALDLDENFVFEYKRSINAQDLEAILAEAYFNLEDYDLAALIVDPDSTLDSNAEDYLEELLSKINQLINLSQKGG
jgi:tetratricopeptide (TPR) repeat protein